MDLPAATGPAGGHRAEPLSVQLPCLGVSSSQIEQQTRRKCQSAPRKRPIDAESTRLTPESAPGRRRARPNGRRPSCRRRHPDGSLFRCNFRVSACFEPGSDKKHAESAKARQETARLTQKVLG